MRITVASSGLGHVARGVEAWAADLGRALAERGEAVTLCKGAGTPEAPHERVLPCWRRSDPKTLWLARRLPRRFVWRLGLHGPLGIEQTTFNFRLIAHLRANRVDILHTQEPQCASTVQLARRLGLVRTRTVLGSATNEPFDFLKKITYLQHLAPYYLEEARAAGAWKPTWRAIPNFIDTRAFRPGRAAALRAELGIPADGLVVLTAAAIKREHKRVDYLLQEFSRLVRSQPQLPVWLVVAGGKEPESDELIQMGRDLLGERVRFLVSYPRPRMAELYQAADLFVLTSLREMFGIVLLEAAASGLPCVVHQHPVIQWVVGPGGHALDMAAPGALAAALQQLLGSLDRCRELGRQARRYCEDNFSQDRVVDQIVDYYRFVHNHARSRRACAAG
jgi:glycosyltransferase involved in cell wall biosynthesis